MNASLNPEKLFAIIGLWYFTNALPPSISPFEKYLRYSILLIALILLCLHWKNSLYTASKDKFLWLLSMLAIVSWLWSVSPETTLLDIRGFLIPMSVFGLYLATRFSLEEQCKLLIFGLGIGIFFSLVDFASDPAAVLNSETWGGAYGHKQNFGSHMTLSFVTLFIIAINTEFYLPTAWVGIAVVSGLILLSGSKSSLIFSILMLAILSLYRQYRWRGKLTVLLLDIGILILGSLITFIVVEWVPLVTSLGKDPTITGRTVIWSNVIPMILKQPFLGYGRFGFWSDSGLVASVFRGKFGAGVNAYIPPHAHNGAIDLMLDVGMVGAVLFFISFSTTYFKALNKAYLSRSLGDIWPLAFLTFLVLDNITESHLMRLQSVFWVLYIATTLSIRKEEDFRRHLEKTKQSRRGIKSSREKSPTNINPQV
ncbi:MAG: O-antigen ligase family protein [Leptolyngbyaceae cyanobacterium MO_188.B28]|nr:O-antigen ligase family protein [Leptolyngbyaceae cyanobacterium MO_188.B28]